MKNLFVRLLSCLLLAVVLIPCAGMAEIDISFDVPDFDDIFTPASGYVIETPYVETVRWYHESGAISFDVPASWTELDSGDGTGFPIFMAEDMVGNMAVSYSPTDGVDMVPLFNELKKKYTDLYEEMGYRVDSFELATYAGRYAMVCEFNGLGVDQVQVMIQPADCSALINFGFAASAIPHIDLVMNSVWLA